MAKKKNDENIVMSSEINLDKVKEELTDYIDLQIKKNLKEEVEKSNKKLLKEKNKKIFWKNIIILILLCVVAYLIYLLNTVDYFDKFFLSNNNASNSVNVNDNSKTDVTIKTEEPSLEELINKYSYLLDNIYINENSEYIKDYYEGNLTEELKKYFVLNSIDIKKITQEDDYNLMDEDFFKEEYLKLFDNYSNGSFSYNENKIRYLSKMHYYISNNIIEKKTSNIKREISDIQIDGEKVIIKTVEGLEKDGKLFNILSLNEIDNYDKKSILEYKDDLNSLTYVFKNGKIIEINN